MKTCTKCQVIKPDSDFNKNSRLSCGLRNWCKLCDRESTRQWRIRNKERVSKANREYKLSHPDKTKNYDLKTKFGISLKQYNKMFEKQHGCCAICGLPQLGLTRAFAVDHNHKTGKIRGLLCISCNTKLGWFENLEKRVLEYKDGVLFDPGEDDEEY